MTVHESVREHRARMLAEADVSGWIRHTEWHYSRKFNGMTVDWWPSGGKARYGGVMVYGHKKVNALIAKLKAAEETPPPPKGELAPKIIHAEERLRADACDLAILQAYGQFPKPLWRKD